MALNALVDSFCHKCGNERVNPFSAVAVYCVLTFNNEAMFSLASVRLSVCPRIRLREMSMKTTEIIKL